MSLASHFQDSFGLSFELFPPKTDAGLTSLFEHVSCLDAFSPSFYTCTYGAGGSTQGKTLEILKTVKQKFHRPVASHLTCVGATVDQLRTYLQSALDGGIDHLVALRGDPPQGQEAFQAVDGGLHYANELVSLIRSEFPQFGVAVAGYPEVHQEAPDAETDLQNLKRKVDAGADIVVTQLFYENQDFYSFQDRYHQIGITRPLVPGLLPVTNLAQIQRITSLCKAKLPQAFVDRLAEKDDADWQFKVGVEFAIAQVEDLLAHGIPGIHFYVLNKSQATARILEAVDLPTSP
ncbi:MAG: methylenetetrahydrofolate reductase [NAD(P)H] [Planctomycetales bacterium]|nr:methylenetetrahydrofolate reductase [NAD(P)H] [Planctomycetales bacterium]